ncbi:plasmid partitioning protein RepB [Pararhizobium sp. BT-229]|uniref:plasmid partitioning protein RepB n=1 Tax=Pararhizobium sp. BT-229 TaxID=2986923 RepID=UPI0021F799C5|nr:plasmid partitioning protein RepB [Pararhizobium sp. BT-229]MCV9967208.1 plasmid partitioning protein RepB [Pararhizobium sp. BT-229]
MSRKDTVNTLFMRKPEGSAPVAGVEKNTDRVRTGAISAMGASLQEMTEGARSAAKLQEQLASGSVVVDLEPSQIDSSSVSDRISITVDPGFEALVDSIRENGQQVPILVRPQAATPGRFQVAYGRRRLRAAAMLGKPVRAIVQTLTDNELVIAQGKENLDRQDLSYIEKAQFARRLEDGGFDRTTIMAALSTDKGDLSRYISIARSIPEYLVQAIGPAPKAGRARWAALAERMERKQNSLDGLITEAQFLAVDSDTRFGRVFEALGAEPAKRKPKAQEWKNPQGKKAARIERDDVQTRIVFDERQVPDFGSYLADRLDALYADFTASRTTDGRH